MKIGILIYSLAGGGAERVVSYLASYCNENIIDLTLILMNDTIKFDVPDNINIYYLEKSRNDEPGYMKALKIPILAYKYSLIVKRLQLTHSLGFLTRPSLINILSNRLTKYKFKVITNERSFPSLQYGYKGFQSIFNRKMIRLLYKKSDLIISNSYGNAEDLINNFEVPSNKMKVIHNPIDLHRVNNIEKIDGFFDKSKFNMITVGRLDEGKNHTIQIKALHKLKNSKLRLYIFGIGELQEDIETLINQLDLGTQVFLMGFDPNPYKYLKSADLFVFSSNHEGFPNVLLEAMACGLPILSTNCQSGPSEILDLKTEKENDMMLTNYGILTPIKNIDIMARGMNYFIEHNSFLYQCKTNGERRIKEFEKNKILKEYIDLIKTTSKS